MSQFKVGDLVWIPDLTHAHAQPEGGSRYNIAGPTYGIVLEINEDNDPSKIRVSVGKNSPPDKLWFKENQIYKEDGDSYGKIC